MDMDVHGCPWTSMDIHGYPWMSMDSMDIHGFPWIFMAQCVMNASMRKAWQSLSFRFKLFRTTIDFHKKSNKFYIQ